MNRTLKAVFLSAGLCSLPSLCFSQIVYNNPGTGTNSYYPTTLEAGDQITLFGPQRTLSQFQFEYYFSGTTVSTQTWTLRLYANDGTTNSPGSALYLGEARPISLGPNGYTRETINFPLSSNLVTLPDTFTWAVQFSNLGPGQTAGLLVSGPPIVGSSFNDFWQRDSSGVWSTMKINGAPFSDFVAQVSAVPEPGVLALGGLGALLLAGFRRFRKTPR